MSAGYCAHARETAAALPDGTCGNKRRETLPGLPLCVVEAVESRAQRARIAQQAAQGIEAPQVVRVVGRQTEVAARGVFFEEMVAEAAEVRLAVECGQCARPYCTVRRNTVSGSISRSAAATIRP